MEVGEGEYIPQYQSLLTLSHRMACIKTDWAAMRAILMLSLTVRNKVSRQCPQTITFEEKGEPKRYRTEVLPLTGQPQ